MQEMPKISNVPHLTPLTLNIIPPNNQAGFYAKNVRNSFFTIQRDPELGLWYRPSISGFGMNTNFLSEDNLRFIKVLIKHHRSDDNRPPLSREIIKSIVKDLDYDSDLWDDIFDNDDVFRSVYSAEDIRKERPRLTPTQVERAKMKKSVDYYMNNSHLVNKFKTPADCRKFIRSRINVFKFCIYLRRCAILYRDTPYKQPLLELIAFLQAPKQPNEEKTNYQWLKKELRVKPIGLIDENWNSGLHEWLTCKKTIEAILRTAGLSEGTEARLSECIWAYKKADGTEGQYLCSEFNWLDLQLLLRTPNKYVIFKSRINTVENGHCGAVNENLRPYKALSGKCTGATTNSPMSEEAFHIELNNLFEQCHTIKDYVLIIQNKYNISIFHDSTPVQAVTPDQRKFLVDGTPTDDLSRLRVFQQKLVRTHQFFYHCERDVDTHERIARESRLLQPQSGGNVARSTPF